MNRTQRITGSIDVRTSRLTGSKPSTGPARNAGFLPIPGIPQTRGTPRNLPSHARRFQNLARIPPAPTQPRRSFRLEAVAPFSELLPVTRTSSGPAMPDSKLPSFALPTASPLRSSFADDPDMAELVAYFVDEVPQRLAALRALCESGDREGVQRLAHQLKGACAGYGFESVGQAAASVEAPLKREASLDDVRDRIDELTRLLERVRA